MCLCLSVSVQMCHASDRIIVAIVTELRGSSEHDLVTVTVHTWVSFPLPQPLS